MGKLLCTAIILLVALVASDAFASFRRKSLPKIADHFQFSKAPLHVLHPVTVTEKNSPHKFEFGLHAISSLYRVSNDATNTQTIGSFLAKLVNILDSLNPTQLLGGVYVLLMVGMIATGIVYRSRQLVNKIRGKHDSELQLYECEFCGLEMRPARDRVNQILSKRGFRCAQCGAPGSAFFNTENMGDPRAVARIRRIQKEKKLEQEKLYGNEDSSNDSDDE